MDNAEYLRTYGFGFKHGYGAALMELLDMRSDVTDLDDPTWDVLQAAIKRLRDREAELTATYVEAR